MQIRQENDLLAQYGSPSRPISPTSLSTPHKKTATTGNEIEHPTVESPAGREPHFQQQHSATLPSQFPPELIDHIVDHLHNDKQSLIQCSRASRAFSHATSYHLFRTVNILSVRKCKEFQGLVWSSLHPPSSTSAPHPSSSSTSTLTAPPSPTPRATHLQIPQANPRPAHLHPSPDRANAHSHTRHTCTSNCDVSAAGWDLSKFVRKIEFLSLDPLSPIEEYVSEAVKLVRMLPRIREVAFRWWTRSTGMEQIARAFAPISATPSHHHGCPPTCQPLSSTSMNTLPEARVGQSPTSDPLKIHLEMVDFESIHAFLDFLGSFGGRLRELSLASVGFGRNGDSIRKDDIRGRFLPGIECLYLGHDAVVKPKGFGPDGPTMGNMGGLFGRPAIDKPLDVCDILELIAPNVSELQLFRNDVGEVYTLFHPEINRTLRLPRFRRLRSVTMSVPGPLWSDLIYKIAAWFSGNESCEGIADPACQDGRASPPLSGTPSLSSSNPVTRAYLRKDRKRTRIRFNYPVRKEDVDWEKLERAVLGEDIEGLDGGCDCSGFGNHGSVARESESGDGNDHVDEMVTKINKAGNHVAGGSCSARFMAGSLWIEVGSGSAVLRDLRGVLGRLDRLGLLQVS